MMMSHVREVVVEMLKFKFGYIFIYNQQNFCMCAYWKRYYSLSMSRKPCNISGKCMEIYRKKEIYNYSLNACVLYVFVP